MVKIYPDMRRLSIIQAEIEDYAQYPGSDCRNGAIVHYKNKSGHQVMENLCSHHAILIPGEKQAKCRQWQKCLALSVLFCKINRSAGRGRYEEKAVFSG